ncbi:branched-subunit amino acid transport protein [Actinoplanes lutulentus]|uniref:Branched-subunit amino acid transport protein AzlD n=1 Tax=Actinoplanes lutulentus TaxID=1287878 RepID=A0A327ZLD0_9ACTN|nr:AzlD domain-containing protein [Actinoplanes lutulentus]MBB2940815.1 branched-subunit amino acid transport protein [Actinoplanes lutulentus]RAK43125.1 branched-subunit amino acid transport protein AzlD [Actinoplanes lutulentus]
MTLWLAIIAVAAGSFALKAAGPALLGDRELPPWSVGVIALLAPALLAALIVVEVLGRRWADLDWTVPVALAAVVVARLLKVPMLLAVLIGVLTAAALRALTG